MNEYVQKLGNRIMELEKQNDFLRDNSALLKSIVATLATELESVWKSIGQLTPNRHAVAARELLAKLRVN